MGLFKSLKGKLDVGTEPAGNAAQSAQYDSSSHDGWTTTEEKRRLFGRDQHDFPGSSSLVNPSDQYAPPPGPPPSQVNSSFSAPPGPPPSQSGGPPAADNPPPYHDWTIIPDTALLPPPPPLPQDHSPTNNASYDSAARAHEWCARNLPYTPSVPSSQLRTSVQRGDVTLDKPPPAVWGRKAELKRLRPGAWAVRTDKHQSDAILLSTLPVYFAAVDHPLKSEASKTIYFEVLVQEILNENSGVAIGFATKPYPPWRLPGWHRGSIGVHGDDGRRFVNDSWGGRDFVEAFRPGETVGVGMTFSTMDAGNGRVKTNAWISRDGRRQETWAWELDEEQDAEHEGVDGLMGESDLYAAVGLFGGIKCEVKFRSEEWIYHPA